MAEAVGPPLRWAVVVVRLDRPDEAEAPSERRAIVVSYEAFHRSGQLTVCPITAARATPRYPGEVAIPIGEAGQTKDGLILCAQARTVSIGRVRLTGILPGGGIAYLSDPRIRAAVRAALRHHLGLDIPPLSDGAAAPAGRL